MRIATDIGGTFTDMVSISNEGDIQTVKTDTTIPNYEQGVINVIQASGVNPKDIDMFIHGSTVVINTLTEREGAKTALITTKGFRDVLEIARGNRPDLFNLRYEKPTPFVERYLRQEVEERLDFKGNVLTPLNKKDIEKIAAFFKKEQVEAVAIAYLYSYLDPQHEIETKEILQELLPDIKITASHEVVREWREYERTNTAVLNAYVKPTASTYLNRLDRRLHEIHIKGNKFVMQSNGGTTNFKHVEETPINIVESGPAAGVYGAAVLGEMIGEKNIIAFDVGGTTAKCSLIDNGNIKVDSDYYIERTDKNAGYPIKIPVVDIIEIGNGGGSIASIDQAGALKVGPKPAGAFPGPIAYGKGGENPTTTDANLLTGRLSLENFEHQTNMEEIKTAFQEKFADNLAMEIEDVALGIIRLANSNMLQALKLISVRKGYDPRDFTLVAYGGGGPLHATALAKELGIKKIVIPIASSVFSAWGMLMTDVRNDYIHTFNTALTDIDKQNVDNKWHETETAATQALFEDGFTEKNIVFARSVDMRYKGQEHTVKVPYPSETWSESVKQYISEAFHQLHENNYSYKLIDNEIEIVNIHLTAFGKLKKDPLKKRANEQLDENPIIETRQVLYEEEGWLAVNVYDRNKLAAGFSLEGPAIVEEATSSTVIYPNQSLIVDEFGNLIITLQEEEN